VWTAGYGGQKALIIRHVTDKVVNSTVLDVYDGFEKVAADTFKVACCIVALLPPHSVQRAERRIRLLEASEPQRIISGTNASGRRCRQRSQTTQHHGWPRRSCSSVGAGVTGFMLPTFGRFATSGKPRELVAI
jgi:hypothetical protein